MEDQRQTGRTTRILIDFLNSTKKHNFIFAPNNQIRDHLFMMALDLFPPNKKVKRNHIQLYDRNFYFAVPYRGVVIRFYGMKDIGIFEDHTLNELEFGLTSSQIEGMVEVYEYAKQHR